jgi:hypothetical protein
MRPLATSVCGLELLVYEASALNQLKCARRLQGRCLQMPFADRLRTLDLGLLLMHPMPPSAMPAGGHAAEEEGREAVSEGLRQLRVGAAREQEWGRIPLLNPPVDANSGMTGNSGI